MDINPVIEIDIRKCFEALIESYRQIIIVTLISLVAGIGIAAFVVEPNNEYKATSSVYSIVYGSLTDSTNSTQALISYGDLVKSYKVAERASLLIGDDKFDKYSIYNMISLAYDSSNYNSSSIIYIHALSSDKSTSVKVANAVAEAFVLEVANLTGKDDIQVLDQAYDAKISYNATSARIKTIILLTILGFIIVCTYIILRKIFSLKMYTSKDATAFGKLDIIGVIPDFKSEDVK